MKRFKWRLQSVLDVKTKQEEIERAALCELTQTLDRMQGELDELKEILSEAIRKLSEEPPLARLEKQSLFMSSVRNNDAAIKRLQARIDEAKKERDKKMDEVLELKKATEGLNKLRTKAEQEFVAEQGRIEQRKADEMTTYRFAKKRMSLNNTVNAKIDI